jgi:hypothetical protein
MTSSGEIGEKPVEGYDATIYFVTHAPVPEGLEDRVHLALKAAPRQGRLLEWPAVAGWMRAAAAAAIVTVVAGGGWGVYRHAQLHQPAKVTVMPTPQVAAPKAGSFSSAGAMRTPQTVQGPAVEEPSKPNVEKDPAIEKNPAAVKPISKWDPNSPQGGTKNSTKATKKQSAVKPIPLALEPTLPPEVPSGKLSPGDR